jgi:hypothetical protein
VKPSWYKTLATTCTKLTSLNYQIVDRVSDDEVSEINALFPLLRSLSAHVYMVRDLRTTTSDLPFIYLIYMKGQTSSDRLSN